MSDWHLGKRERADGHQSPVKELADARYQKMRNVSLIGLVTNFFLCSTKLVIGWIAQSQALIADGIHSLADGLTDAAVIVTARFSNESADLEHPYGHHRIETAATAGLGLVLIATGLGIIFDAIQRLMDPEALFRPTSWALVGAGVSILVNEALYQYTRWVGKAVKSSLLLANAWHHRTDALSSVAVLFGVAGVLMGWESLDAVAAVIVALMIIHVGWQQLTSTFSELIDSGLAADRLEELTRVIESIEGVSHPHRLRTRKMGGHVLMDVHVEVDPRISVSEGHQLAESVQDKLKVLVDDVHDVIVHIDPKGQDHVWLDLPQRSDVMADLKQCLSEGLFDRIAQGAHGVTMHYLDGVIDLDIRCSVSTDATLDPRDEIQRLTVGYQAAQALPYVREVHVLFEGS